MPATKRLTKESEQRILDALGDVRILLDGGTNPDDAIVKIATSKRIPAEHIQLMVNAVNTGLTNEHRQSTDDLFKRAEEFPLANTKNILDRLYPATIKTASAVQYESGVSDEYSRKPANFMAARKVMEKHAYVLPPLTDKKPTEERYEDLPQVRIAKAAASVKEAENIAGEARLQAQRASDVTIAKMANFVDYFLRPGHIKFAEVRYNVAATFGELGKELMEVVATRLPASVTKEAAINRLFDPVRLDTPPYSLAKAVLDARKDFCEKKAAYEASAITVKEAAEKAFRPFYPLPRQGGSVLGDQSWEYKQAGIFGDIFKTTAGALTTQHHNNLIKDTKQDDVKNLMDPAHEATIRNIQAAALLNDLMANDEVIKSHEPQDVLDAYNEISQLSPRSSTQKAIMRDAIRKRLSGGAGALDNFMLDSLAGIENKMRDRDAPEGGNLEILKSIGGLPGSDAGSKKHASVLA